MLKIEECREHLKKYNLTDEEIKEIRDNLTGIIDSILDSYLKKFR